MTWVDELLANSDADNLDSAIRVYELRSPTGKFLGMIEEDYDDKEVLADIERCVGIHGLLMKDTDYADGSSRLVAYKDGRPIAELDVTASFLRPREIPKDSCRHCGSTCDFVTLAFRCPHGHGVR